MRLFEQRALSLLLSAALLARSASVLAQAPADEAKRHFVNGVHLFEDKNFAGALAEFQASYEANPTAVALQNLAVCQKGLFRYTAAIATLEKLLAEFGATLPAGDRKAAEDAIREMSGLLGTIVVLVKPADAVVSVNGSSLSPEAARAPIRLGAGEYRVSAEAPGYARAEQIITVASGDKEKKVKLELVAQMGTLSIRSKDPEAAIAIDRAPTGWGQWTGPVPAGAHLVHVYKPGVKPFVAQISVQAGQVTTIDAELGPADTGPYQGPFAPPPDYTPPVQRGFYALIGAGGDYLTGELVNMHEDGSRPAGGTALARVGYRLSNPIAIEGLAEATTHPLKACSTLPGGAYDTKTGQCDAGMMMNASFATARFGAGVRYHIPLGQATRVYGELAAGVARHVLKDVAGQADQMGADGFGMLEGGFEWNLGHWVLAAAAGGTVEGTSKIDAFDKKSIGQGGVSLRFGWSQWAP